MGFLVGASEQKIGLPFGGPISFLKNFLQFKKVYYKRIADVILNLFQDPKKGENMCIKMNQNETLKSLILYTHTHTHTSKVCLEIFARTRKPTTAMPDGGLAILI